MYATPVNTAEETGRRLQRHRKQSPKITLNRLASETKSLTVSAISNYEQGIRQLRPREAKILAGAFSRLGRPISVSELLGIEEQHKEQRGALTRHEEAIIEIYRQFPPSVRKRFLDHLHAFASACGIDIKRVA